MMSNIVGDNKMEVVWIALLVAIIWGSAQIVHRKVLPTISPQFVMLISAIVYLISVIVYVGIFGRKMVHDDFVNNSGYIPLLALTTFMGLFLANILYLYAIKHTTNINIVSVLSALYPVITLILAFFILKESLSWKGLFGFSLIIIGIVVMLTSKCT
jgi:drug/metabolite transporter (DMT)-like permease